MLIFTFKKNIQQERVRPWKKRRSRSISGSNKKTVPINPFPLFSYVPLLRFPNFRLVFRHNYITEGRTGLCHFSLPAAFSAFIFQSGMETRLHLMVSSCFLAKLSAEAAFFVLTAEAWLCLRLVSVCRGSGGFQARGSNAGGVILLAFRQGGAREHSGAVCGPAWMLFLLRTDTNISRQEER